MFVLHTHHPSLPRPPSPPSTNRNGQMYCSPCLCHSVTLGWWLCGLFVSQSQLNGTLCSFVSCHYCTNHTECTHINTHNLLFCICLTHITWHWGASELGFSQFIACWLPLFESGRVQQISMAILMLIFLQWALSHTNTFSGSHSGGHTSSYENVCTSY